MRQNAERWPGHWCRNGKYPGWRRRGVGFGNNGGANRICLVYCHYRELLSYKAAQLSCQILFALCLNPKVFSSLAFWCAMSSQLGQAEPRLLSDVSTLHCNIDGLSIKTAAKNQHWPRPAYCPDAWPLPSPCLSRAALPWQSEYGRDHELILSSSPAPDKLQDI